MSVRIHLTKGFTLIELLIVVAIIAILAAIAVPNFLEAQTRSKIARARADLRTVDMSMQTYVIDHNTTPRPNSGGTGDIGWWGFVSAELTTPVAYMSSRPTMAFFDDFVLGFWKSYGGSQDNQPYTYIRNMAVPCNMTPPAFGWKGRKATNNATISAMLGPDYITPNDWWDQGIKSNYLIYCCGPDRVDSTVWGTPQWYDPSNGTMSFGDLYRFGAGEAVDNTKR